MGDTIALQLSITNVSKRAMHIDDSAVISCLIFTNAAGTEIAQWPFMDILATEPGIEAYWTLSEGKTQSVAVSFAFKRDRWSGFGVPDGEYEGMALEVSYSAGRAIHAVAKLPAAIRVELR